MAHDTFVKDVMDALAEVRKELRGLRASLDAVVSILFLVAEEIEPIGTPEELDTNLVNFGTKDNGFERS